MFTRRQRKPPKGGYRSPMAKLVKQALAELAQCGQMQASAAPWLAAADLHLTLQRCCRPVCPEETPERHIEESLAHFGIQCTWTDEGLVLTLPGWTPRAPQLVAIQPQLLETS